MSRSQYGRKKRLMAEINVVPYIDVMLVLLVIFMVTAPLLSQGVKVDLPQAASEPLPDNQVEPFVVTVDREGNYFLNDNDEKVVDAREIKLAAESVLRNSKNTPFMVRGDGAVEYSAVIDAMVLLKQAGVPSVGLVTESPDS